MKYILPLFAIWLLMACKKDENNGPTNTQMLSSSPWKYESGGVDQDKNGTIEISFAAVGILQPCILDNTATFNSNGTGVTDEGATKCSVVAPQTAPFTWSFTNSETAINITGSVLGLGGTFKIASLTSTKFSLTKDTTIIFGSTPANVALIVNMQH